MSPPIFISYSRQDQELMIKIKKSLEEKYFEVWVDQSGLLPGQAWRAGIVDAIEECSAFIIVLSPASARSRNVMKELALAEEYGKKIIPLLHQTCILTPEMKYVLAGMQYQDFSQGSFENNLTKLIQVLERSSLEKTPTIARNEITIESGIPAKTLTIGDVEFVLVPKGPFLMGCKEGDEFANESEVPQHTVEISQNYWIARFVITNAQFERFMRAKPDFQTTAENIGSGWVFNGKGWKEIRGASWQHPFGPHSNIQDKQNHPVVQVTWYDAMSYCAWFNAIYRQDLSDLEIRLPSEAEWEKAARGPYGYLWPWGDVWDVRRCNSSESGTGDTTPVGHYSIFGGDSPCGAADMVGNVYEWTSSLWGTQDDKPTYRYPYNPQDGRENSKAGSDIQRVLRGGSYLKDRTKSRCTLRASDIPSRVSMQVSIRIIAYPSI